VAKNSKPSSALIKPWTFRLFEALPASIPLVGVCIACVLLGLFLIGRFVVDGGANSTSGDFRLAIIHILLVAYCASAYVYVLSSSIRTTHELKLVIENRDYWTDSVNQVGKHLWWGLVLAGLLGISINVYATTVTTVGSDPWNWAQTYYDARWMRVLGPFFTAWIVCFLYALAIESARLSRLSTRIAKLDLLDLRLYQPLVRQGLTNALLLVGMSSVFALFFLEPGFTLLMVQIFTVFTVFAWVGLMLPIRGIRKKINIVKDEELDWCQQALKHARGQLKAEREVSPSIAEITAYKEMIDKVGNWPFDSPTLTRFALYLLIPIGSMFGGALVERGLDLFLF
jgi:hypothetical protein